MDMKILLAGAMLLASTAALAGPAATLDSPGLGYTSAPYTLGFFFTLGGNTTATKLGIYDSNGDGLETEAQVGLWKADGTLLGSTIVGSGTSGQLIGAYRYVDISHIALTSGESYVVGSYMNSSVSGSASSFNTGQGGSGSFDGLITFAQDRYTNFDSAFGFPTFTNNHQFGNWAGGNVVFGVPEPTSWVMLIAGFGLVGAAQRRRRAVAA